MNNNTTKKTMFGSLPRSKSTPTFNNVALNDISPPMPTRPRMDSVKIDPFEGHSNVTRAPTPPRKYALDELIDPETIPDDGRSHVRSPSGDILNKQQFLSRADRPDSIRERQEKILQKTRSFSSMSQLGKDEALPPPPTVEDMKALPPLPTSVAEKPIPPENGPKITAFTEPTGCFSREAREAREKVEKEAREKKRRQRRSKILTCGLYDSRFCSSQ